MVCGKEQAVRLFPTFHNYFFGGKKVRFFMYCYGYYVCMHTYYVCMATTCPDQQITVV